MVIYSITNWSVFQILEDNGFVKGESITRDFSPRTIHRVFACTWDVPRKPSYCMGQSFSLEVHWYVTVKGIYYCTSQRE